MPFSSTKFNSVLRNRSPSGVKRASVPRIVVCSPLSGASKRAQVVQQVPSRAKSRSYPHWPGDPGRRSRSFASRTWNVVAVSFGPAALPPGAPSTPPASRTNCRDRRAHPADRTTGHHGGIRCPSTGSRARRTGRSRRKPRGSLLTRLCPRRVLRASLISR